ncbi:MAG: AAA family ATPase [Alphaproteobacteria bacterium]
MLNRITITDFVIFTTLTVNFTDGLTALTGETGAGKSILLDAMGLILGDPPDREAIRQGAEQCVIEAFFTPPKNHPIWGVLAKHEGLSMPPGELKIKRTIGQTDKDEITINDVTVDLPFIKALGMYLIEIHGQGANQSFLAPENQMLLLDLYGAYPPHILTNVADAYEAIQQIAKDLAEERTFFTVAGREKTALERIVTACDKIGMKKGFYQELKVDLANLVTIREIRDLFQSINAQLIAQTGVELTLARIRRMLDSQKDEALTKMKESIRIALEQSREAIHQMEELAPKYINVDTTGITGMEKKIETIVALAAQRKVTPEEFSDTDYDFIVARLARIRAAPAKIKEFDLKLIKANEVYRQHATILSDERKIAAKKLSDEITSEMAPLKMPNAQAQVEVTVNPNERTPRGFNTVIFTARMNPGALFSPIAKTASGGELARVILALKMILQQVQVVSTLIFDEIDVGIGGSAAAAVGGRIARLAETTQILVVTHSPQVASRGTQHLHASKKTDGLTTQTVVSILSQQERIDELSRMLAGEEITGEAVSAAKTLIEEARVSAETRKNRNSASA